MQVNNLNLFASGEIHKDKSRIWVDRLNTTGNLRFSVKFSKSNMVIIREKDIDIISNVNINNSELTYEINSIIKSINI